MRVVPVSNLCFSLRNIDILQDNAALELEPWRRAHWMLEQLDLPELQAILGILGVPAPSSSKADCIRLISENKRAKGALQQASITCALLAVIFRLQLLILDRLPAEQQHAHGSSVPSKRVAPSQDLPLYSIQRFGTAAANAEQSNKEQRTQIGQPHAARCVAGSPMTL